MTSAGMSSRDFAIFTMLTTAHYFNHCPRRMNSGVCGAGSVLIFELLSDELPLAKARGTLFGKLCFIAVDLGFQQGCMLKSLVFRHEGAQLSPPIIDQCSFVNFSWKHFWVCILTRKSLFAHL